MKDLEKQRDEAVGTIASKDTKIEELEEAARELRAQAEDLRAQMAQIERDCSRRVAEADSQVEALRMQLDNLSKNTGTAEERLKRHIANLQDTIDETWEKNGVGEIRT